MNGANIPQIELLPNTQKKTIHFILPEDVLAYFRAWKSLNKFANRHLAMEHLIRQHIMSGFNSTNDTLSNNDITIRKHQPIKAQTAKAVDRFEV